jgi:hypothetical protein
VLVRLSRWHAGVHHGNDAAEHVLMSELIDAIAVRALVHAYSGIWVEFVVCFGCFPIRSAWWRRTWK